MVNRPCASKVSGRKAGNAAWGCPFGAVLSAEAVRTYGFAQSVWDRAKSGWLPAAALPQTPRYCVNGETNWLWRGPALNSSTVTVRISISFRFLPCYFFAF